MRPLNLTELMDSSPTRLEEGAITKNIPTMASRDSIHKETGVIAQTEELVQSPNLADSYGNRIGSATPPLPSEHSDVGWENGLHTERNMYGMIDDRLTPKEADFHAYAAFLSQETMKRSDSERYAEVLRPFKKIREGEAAEPPMCTKACHGRELSVGSPKEVDSILSFPTTECKKRPEHSEAAAEESTVVQTESTQFLSHVAQKNRPLYRCSEISNSQLLKDNGGVPHKNLLTPSEPITPLNASNRSHMVSDSNVFHNLFPEGYTTSNDYRQYENAHGDNKSLHSASLTTDTFSSSTQQDEGPLPLQVKSLPFMKRSDLWDTFESCEIFQSMPQQPHFLPLEKCNEVFREGFAIGSMLSFVTLVEKISNAKFDDPASMLENKLKALAGLEKLGFNVQPIEVRLKELLRIKASYSLLDGRLKAAERDVSQGKCKVDELEKSITQLKMKIQTLMLEKERSDDSVAELQRSINAIKERMQGFSLDFDSVIATPLSCCTEIVHGVPMRVLDDTAEKTEYSKVQLPKQVPAQNGLPELRRRSNRIKRKTQWRDRKAPEEIDVESINIQETNKIEMSGQRISMTYEPPHRDLKTDEVIVFNWIYSNDADQHEIILDLYNSFATRSQFYCMLGQAWVLNVIVDNWVCYLNHLQKKDAVKQHYFPIIYMEKICSGDFGENTVNGYLKKLEYPLQECERFFFPSQRARHWLLYVVEPKENKIAILDSLKEKQAPDHNLKHNILRFLEYAKVQISRTSHWDMYDIIKDLPLQENGDDCGIFIMKYMQYWNGKELECGFSQADIPLFRHQIPVDMVKSKFNKNRPKSTQISNNKSKS